MTELFTNNFPIINLHKKPSVKSEIVTQMIYGESFYISQKNKKWFKIRIKEDGYKGFIKIKSFPNYFKPTHKVSLLKSKIYKLPKRGGKFNELSFGSKIKVEGTKGKFYKFSKGWIYKNDVKPISFKEKNPFKKISIFRNIKYKWGGKSFKGIDCSALIQVFLNFNNRFCPRDAKDQVRYFKKNVNLKK